MYKLKSNTFVGTFPFNENYHFVNGFQMHYVDEGSGDPVVLVHGDPMWGYLYRKFIPVLSRKSRCIVPDHMGMGKSGINQDLFPFVMRHHIDNFESLMLFLDLTNITLVIHDWGGPVGLGFGIRHPERIKRLVVMNSWAFAPWPGGALPRLIEVVRSEKGPKFVMEKNGYLESAIRGGVMCHENLNESVMNAYRAPFPTTESRRTLVCWSRDIATTEEDTSWLEMKRIENAMGVFSTIPVLLIWGMKDLVLPEAALRLWMNKFPNAQVYKIVEAGHFLQEDAPENVISCIEEFIEKH